MTPYQSHGKGPYKVRLGHVTLSTGMYTLSDAKHVAMQIARWRGKQGREHARPNVLAMLVRDDSPLSLRQAYDKALTGTLDAFMADYEARTNALDLRPYVTEWHQAKQRSRKGSASANDYKRQLETLYHETPLTIATFRRSEVLQRLRMLSVDDPTRNRYKAAASSFAQYLVDREVLDANFVLTIKGYFSENPERVVWYDMADARRLIAALPQPYAGLSAYAAGFGAEWGAITRLQPSYAHLDETPVTFRVHGTKTTGRDRVVPLVPELAWTLEYITPVLRGKTPFASVFAGVANDKALDVLRETADALKIKAHGEEKFGRHDLHDWRHDHAVWLIKANYQVQIVAAHLGHETTSQVIQRYGKYRPDALDYATKSATTSRRNMKRRGRSA